MQNTASQNSSYTKQEKTWLKGTTLHQSPGFYQIAVYFSRIAFNSLITKTLLLVFWGSHGLD